MGRILEPSITTTRSTPRLISTALAVLLWLAALAPLRLGRRHELLELFVTEPYLELHTGPGGAIRCSKWLSARIRTGAVPQD